MLLKERWALARRWALHVNIPFTLPFKSNLLPPPQYTFQHFLHRFLHGQQPGCNSPMVNEPIVVNLLVVPQPPSKIHECRKCLHAQAIYVIGGNRPLEHGIFDGSYSPQLFIQLVDVICVPGPRGHTCSGSGNGTSGGKSGKRD